LIITFDNQLPTRVCDLILQFLVLISKKVSINKVSYRQLKK